MTHTVAQSPTRGHCPECGPDRSADVVGHHSKRYEDSEYPVWGETDYRILQCRGCQAVYFQTDSVFSEDEDYRLDPRTGEYETVLAHKITYWPAPSKRRKPEWSDKLLDKDMELDSLFNEIYTALNNDLRVLAAMGIRIALDRASTLLGIDPTKTFAHKLDELVALGKIGEDEKVGLLTLTDAGGAAAHRAWRPDPSELNTMMDIIEAFVYRAFILYPSAERLKQSVPERPRRKA